MIRQRAEQLFQSFSSAFTQPPPQFSFRKTRAWGNHIGNGPPLRSPTLKHLFPFSSILRRGFPTSILYRLGGLTLRCMNRRVLALLDVNAWGCFHCRNKRAATNMPTRRLQIIVNEKLMSKMIDTYRYHSIVFMYRTVIVLQAEDGQRETDEGVEVQQSRNATWQRNSEFEYQFIPILNSLHFCSSTIDSSAFATRYRKCEHLLDIL
jgi:hypothetical protein